MDRFAFGPSTITIDTEKGGPERVGWLERYQPCSFRGGKYRSQGENGSVLPTLAATPSCRSNRSPLPRAGFVGTGRVRAGGWTRATSVQRAVWGRRGGGDGGDGRRFKTCELRPGDGMIRRCGDE